MNSKMLEKIVCSKNFLQQPHLRLPKMWQLWRAPTKSKMRDYDHSESAYCKQQQLYTSILGTFILWQLGEILPCQHDKYMPSG